MKKKLKGHPTAKVESLINFMLRVNSGLVPIKRKEEIRGKKEKKKRK
tara:strand:- start:6033 stop:6173 length:141 start_codon:yes stop_codon:yes gene_type:complete